MLQRVCAQAKFDCGSPTTETGRNSGNQPNTLNGLISERGRQVKEVLLKTTRSPASISQRSHNHCPCFLAWRRLQAGLHASLESKELILLKFVGQPQGVSARGVLRVCLDLAATARYPRLPCQLRLRTERKLRLIIWSIET